MGGDKEPAKDKGSILWKWKSDASEDEEKKKPEIRDMFNKCRKLSHEKLISFCKSLIKDPFSQFCQYDIRYSELSSMQKESPQAQSEIRSQNSMQPCFQALST